MYMPCTVKSQVKALGLETTYPNIYNSFRPPIGANVRMVSQTGSLSLLSTSFPINYSIMQPRSNMLVLELGREIRSLI